MEQEMRITPEGLFYLGKQLGGQYIDYDYVAALHDIGNNPTMHENRARAELSRKGIIQEDFSGNVELLPAVKERVEPIFLGDFESCIDICILQENSIIEKKKYHYHFYDGQITKVTLDKDEWILSACRMEDVLEECRRCLPRRNETASNPSLDPDKVFFIVSCKNVKIGNEDAIKIYYACDDFLFEEGENEKMISVSWEQAVESAYYILTSERER